MEEIEFESLYQATPVQVHNYCKHEKTDTNTCQDQEIWNMPVDCEEVTVSKDDYYKVKQKALSSTGEFPIILAPTDATITRTEETYKSSQLKLQVTEDQTTLIVPNITINGNQEILGDIIVHGKIDGNFKGTVNTSTEISSLHNYKQGWHWIVETPGQYVGQDCEAGDMIYCVRDFSGVYLIDDFQVIQTNVNYVSKQDIDNLFNRILYNQ